jgi:hypothetical protein
VSKTTVKEVRVRNRKGEHKGFWRAKIYFGPEWGKYEVTAGQLRQIEAEPMLEVRETGPPGDPEERLAMIVEAVGGLDPDNSGHFTQSGVPQVKVIEDALGFDITSEERDKAWETYSGGEE